MSNDMTNKSESSQILRLQKEIQALREENRILLSSNKTLKVRVQHNPPEGAIKKALDRLRDEMGFGIK